MQEPVILIDEKRIKEITDEKNADISGLSIACMNKGTISTKELGVTDNGYDLYLMSKFPSTVEVYKNSYILVGIQLYYIKLDGQGEKVPLTDFRKFTKQLTTFRGDNKSNKIHLSRQQLKTLITLNGSHKPEDTNIPIDSTTIFGAASLSKTVFAFLVLTLIEANKSKENELGLGKFHLPKNLSQFDLDTPLYKILPELSQCKDKARAEALTARMILSHQSGILCSQQEDSLPDFFAHPGNEYEYGGLPYFYLQIAIDRLTKSSLQELAQKFVFNAIKGMENSTFLRPVAPDIVYGDEKELAKQFPADLSKFPAICANSLRTTASDYMHFIAHWLNDERLSYAFDSQASMTKDRWARNMGLSNDFLQRLASGLGWALQKNEQGKVVRAFHWADMNQWRADVAINLEDKTAIVYLANSPNGHILADHIISPNVELADGLKYISEKLGFAIRYEKDWQGHQNKRFEKINQYLASRSELAVSDFEMTKSAFGQGSNTAKMSNQNNQGTTARLIGRGIVTVAPKSSRKKELPHPAQHKGTEKKDTLEIQKKETDKLDPTATLEPKDKPNPDFSTERKTPGYKKP